MRLTLLGVPPAHCLVVEDAQVGLAAGRAAGAVTAGLKGLAADIQLTDLHQLAGMLQPPGPALPI